MLDELVAVIKLVANFIKHINISAYKKCHLTRSRSFWQSCWVFLSAHQLLNGVLNSLS